MRFCLCIFESDTVKSDCPVQIFRTNGEIFKDLIQTVGFYLTSFAVVFFSGDIIKKLKKKGSENDQLTECFFRPLVPISDFFRKSTNKKILA